MHTMTIGQVAKHAGVGVETVRFYERKGLLEAPPRRDSGYRQYSQEVIRRIRFIRRAKDLGFSLKEIGELLCLRVDPDTTCAEVKERAQAKIVAIDVKLRELRRVKAALVQLAAACSGQGPTSQCPILDALGMHDG
jgi:MerR family copper efflux transcriptional regulator